MRYVLFKFITLTCVVIGLLAQSPHKVWAQENEYTDRNLHASQANSQRQCSSSQKWDSKKNMCVTTKDSKGRRDDARECSKLEDDAARKACHDNLASQETGVSKGDEHSDSGGLDMSIPVLTAALSGTMMLSSKSMTSGPCISVPIMAGTSLVGLASEYFYKNEAEEKLKSLQSSYEKETASDEAYNAQKRAFEFLKKEQELIAKFEEKRKNTMYIMTAGFAAASIAAFTTDRLVGSCGTGDGDKPEAFDRKGDTPGGHGQTSANSNGNTGITPSLATQGLNFIKGPLGDPTVIGASSGLAAAATLILGAEAGKQSKSASNNAKTVQAMIEKFDADFEQFCPQGREDMSDPGCFCYSIDGSKNQDRTNSQTCQNLWAKRDKSLFASADDYSSQNKKTRPRGCAFFNGNFDKECKCKQMKNKKGKNACLKVGVPSSVAANLSGAIPLPRVLGRINRAAEGGINTGVFNPDQLSQDAKATNRVAQRVLSKALKDKTGKGPPSANELLAQRLNKIPKAVVDQINATSGGSASGIAASTRPKNPELAEALKKAGVKDPVATTSVGYASKGSDLRKNGNNNEEEQDYFGDWGDSSNGGAQGEALTFLDKKYEYEQNDIVERDDISLWEIISRRYTQTGLRRLFPDEEQPLKDLD